MRLTQNRTYDRSLRRKLKVKSESRDAIVWDVDETNFLARCKIQGSNELVLCHYPRNWQTTPVFMKRGNAVRIAHRGGERGYLEIIGHGRAVPTAVSGSSFPTEEALADTLLTGGSITQYSGMTVQVGTTTYRINETTYSLTLASVTMAASSDTTMNVPPPMTMGGEAVFVTLSSAPATTGFWRYDLLVAGTDSAIDVVEGTSSTDPQMPSVPANHVKVGHVLVKYGVTEITNTYINLTFEPRKITSLTFTPASGSGTVDADGYFTWDSGDDTPYISIRAEILDQYGDSLDPADATSYDFSTYFWNVNWLADGLATGGISKVASGFTQDDLTYESAISYIDIYYERNQLAATEFGPIIEIDMDNTPLGGVHKQVLLASDGTPLA